MKRLFVLTGAVLASCAVLGSFNGVLADGSDNIQTKTKSRKAAVTVRAQNADAPKQTNVVGVNDEAIFDADLKSDSSNSQITPKAKIKSNTTALAG